MQINNLPEKYKKLWDKVLSMIQEDGRAGDDLHAKETVELVLGLKDKYNLDLDVFIPVAMMHDIGHVMILPEHMKYLTGSDKLGNSKLAHMLVGAKIAKDLLEEIEYDPLKTKEIVDIISIHDMSQIEDVDVEGVYDTENKKLFHDIDAMGRFSLERIKAMMKKLPMKDPIGMMEREFLNNFFYPDMQKIALEKFEKLKEEL